MCCENDAPQRLGRERSVPVARRSGAARRVVDARPRLSLASLPLARFSLTPNAANLCLSISS